MKGKSPKILSLPAFSYIWVNQRPLCLYFQHFPSFLALSLLKYRIKGEENHILTYVSAVYYLVIVFLKQIISDIYYLYSLISHLIIYLAFPWLCWPWSLTSDSLLNPVHIFHIFSTYPLCLTDNHSLILDTLPTLRFYDSAHLRLSTWRVYLVI